MNNNLTITHAIVKIHKRKTLHIKINNKYYLYQYVTKKLFYHVH